MLLQIFSPIILLVIIILIIINYTHYYCYSLHNSAAAAAVLWTLHWNWRLGQVLLMTGSMVPLPRFPHLASCDGSKRKGSVGIPAGQEQTKTSQRCKRGTALRAKKTKSRCSHLSSFRCSCFCCRHRSRHHQLPFEESFFTKCRKRFVYPFFPNYSTGWYAIDILPL